MMFILYFFVRMATFFISIFGQNMRSTIVKIKRLNEHFSQLSRIFLFVRENYKKTEYKTAKFAAKKRYSSNNFILLVLALHLLVGTKNLNFL